MISSPLAAALSLFLALPPGARIPADFSVSNLDGATEQFSELRGPARVAVVGFISTKCPVSQAYLARIERLYREFSAKGVAFLLLNANDNETVQEIRRQHENFKFPVYKDYHNRAADLFEAQTTPEMFVLDRTGAIRYHGAIDDATNEARVKNHALRNAVEALLAGKQPPVTELKAFGCVLKRVKSPS